MELKQEIIDAGLFLQDKELIARTWGTKFDFTKIIDTFGKIFTSDDIK